MKFVKTEFNETDTHFDENIEDIKLPSFIEVTQIPVEHFDDEAEIEEKPKQNFIDEFKADPVSGTFFMPLLWILIGCWAIYSVLVSRFNLLIPI